LRVAAEKAKKERPMNFRNHAKTLAAAALFSLVVLSIPAVHAQAKPFSGPPDSGDPTVCYFIDTDGAVGLRNVGETYTDKNGHVFICGADGWFHQISGTIVHPTLPISVPQSAGNTQVP
jgi:hypothetical protein